MTSSSSTSTSVAWSAMFESRPSSNTNVSQFPATHQLLNNPVVTQPQQQFLPPVFSNNYQCSTMMTGGGQSSGESSFLSSGNASPGQPVAEAVPTPDYGYWGSPVVLGSQQQLQLQNRFVPSVSVGLSNWMYQQQATRYQQQENNPLSPAVATLSSTCQLPPLHSGLLFSSQPLTGTNNYSPDSGISPSSTTTTTNQTTTRRRIARARKNTQVQAASPISQGTPSASDSLGEINSAQPLFSSPTGNIQLPSISFSNLSANDDDLVQNESHSSNGRPKRKRVLNKKQRQAANVR